MAGKRERAIIATKFGLPLDEEQLAALNRTIAREQALFDHVAAAPRGSLEPRKVRALADALADDAYQVLAVSYFVADREVERLGASADDVQSPSLAIAW